MTATVADNRISRKPACKYQRQGPHLHPKRECL